MIIGHHIRNYVDHSLQKSLEVDKSHIEEIVKVPFGCFQIFVVGPKNTKHEISDSDKAYFRSISNDYNIFIHGTYMDMVVGKTVHHGKQLIKRELKIAHEINAKGIIIHIPKGTVNEIFITLNQIFESPEIKKIPQKLFLEINHFKDATKTNNEHELFITPISLKKLFDKIKTKEWYYRIGLCIDTAHLWSSGIDISECDSTHEYITLIEKYIINSTPTIPYDNILIHLNDQENTFNSGLDKHCKLMGCDIWKNKTFKQSGLKTILDWIKTNNINTILERNTVIDKKVVINDLIEDYVFLKKHGYF